MAKTETKRKKPWRTVRTRLTRKQFMALSDRLSHEHWSGCTRGSMICGCEFAQMIRGIRDLGWKQSELRGTAKKGGG